MHHDILRHNLQDTINKGSRSPSQISLYGGGCQRNLWVMRKEWFIEVRDRANFQNHLKHFTPIPQCQKLNCRLDLEEIWRSLRIMFEKENGMLAYRRYAVGGFFQRSPRKQDKGGHKSPTFNGDGPTSTTSSNHMVARVARVKAHQQTPLRGSP